MCKSTKRNIIFQSTPSARRATGSTAEIEDDLVYFNPRPPRGGRPNPLDLIAHHKKISIHALREEGDWNGHWMYPFRLGISIHALREEGDPNVLRHI